MAAAVGLRGDFDGPRLRALAKATKNAAHARRLLALAEVYAGGMRSDAARIGGVGLQTVRDWVLRFNACGPDGLIGGKAPGNRPKLDHVQRKALAASWRAGRFPPSMEWCAGGSSIWRSGSLRSSGSRSVRPRSVASSSSSASASSRRGHATMRRTRRRWMPLKKPPGRAGEDQGRPRRRCRDRSVVAVYGSPPVRKEKRQPQKTLLQRIRPVRGQGLPRPQWEPLGCVPYKTTRSQDLLPPPG